MSCVYIYNKKYSRNKSGYPPFAPVWLIYVCVFCLPDGAVVGRGVGFRVGLFVVGLCVGCRVGRFVGRLVVGCSVGCLVGRLVVGTRVGSGVGVAVGVAAQHDTRDGGGVKKTIRAGGFERWTHTINTRSIVFRKERAAPVGRAVGLRVGPFVVGCACAVSTS